MIARPEAVSVIPAMPKMRRVVVRRGSLTPPSSLPLWWGQAERYTLGHSMKRLREVLRAMEMLTQYRVGFKDDPARGTEYLLLMAGVVFVLFLWWLIAG